MGILKSLLNKIFNEDTNIRNNRELKYNKVSTKDVIKNEIKLKYDTEFIIDYLNINFEENLKDVKIIFPSSSNKIIINGESMYFNSSYIKEVGRSSDNLYRKIYTKNFAFWITPCDYNDILNIMKDREVKYQNEKQETKTSFKNLYSEKFEYDEIDTDIYKCCIVDKSDTDLGNIDCGGNAKDFRKVEQYISDLCKENNGRYYKTVCKNVKFVIIFACNSRTATNVTHYRNKGYKVTSFENAIKYFNLINLWDINKMENEVLRIKETVYSM